MSSNVRPRVGFLSPVPLTSPHFASFQTVIPAAVELDFQDLGASPETGFEGRLTAILERTRELVRERDWQAAIIPAAPVELANPGLLEQAQAAVDVPVTTALSASAAALNTLRARRVLLLTPFGPAMNAAIRAYLAGAGIESISPPKTFDHYLDPQRLSPRQVFDFTREALAEAGGVQAVYFQGSVLDPIPVIEQLESELQTTVVQSNLSMLWHILSLLGLTFQVPNAGRLLREWPSLVG